MSCSKRFYLSTRKRILTQATETNTVMLLITRPCFLNNTHTHTHTRFKAVFQDYPCEPVPERYNQSGFY